MIEIKIDDRDIQTALRRLQRQAGDLTPAMQEIGEYLVQSTKERFSTGQPGRMGFAWLNPSYGAEES